MQGYRQACALVVCRVHTTGIRVVRVGTLRCLSWKARGYVVHLWLVVQPLGHVHPHMGIRQGARWGVVLPLGCTPEAGTLSGGLRSRVLCLGTCVCHP